jgi:c-di-GMP-binding flagellar brake protein YcgR
MSDEQDERRTEPRHKTEGGACAIIDDSYIHLGHIIDISEGGMSFIYAGSELPARNTLELSIYLYNNNFFINKIPARIVSNYKIPHESLFDFVVLMRCSLQFDALSDNQRIDLINLIQSYTLGYA